MPEPNQLKVFGVSISKSRNIEPMYIIRRYNANKHRWVSFAKATYEQAKELMTEQYKAEVVNKRTTLKAITKQGEKIKYIDKISKVLVGRFGMKRSGRRYKAIFNALNSLSAEELDKLYKDNKDVFALIFRYMDKSFNDVGETGKEDKESRLQLLEQTLGLRDEVSEDFNTPIAKMRALKSRGKFKG